MNASTAAHRAIHPAAQPNPDWNSDTPDPATSNAPWRIYNIGNEESVELMRYIEVLENCLGKKAKMEMLPLQPGDVPATEASMQGLQNAVGYSPSVRVEQGIKNFVDWYLDYYSHIPL